MVLQPPWGVCNLFSKAIELLFCFYTWVSVFVWSHRWLPSPQNRPLIGHRTVRLMTTPGSSILRNLLSLMGNRWLHPHLWLPPLVSGLYVCWLYSSCSMFRSEFVCCLLSWFSMFRSEFVCCLLTWSNMFRSVYIWKKHRVMRRVQNNITSLQMDKARH